MTNAFSISIFLPQGPEGPRLIEKTNWTGKAVACSRNNYPETRDRAEFDGCGVYVLYGPSEDPNRKRIYIGESDVLRNRLNGHLKAKDFWEHLVLFTSKDGSLNKAHARFIESLLVDRAHSANRDDIENGNAPTASNLSEPEQAFARAFCDEMLSMYPVIGLSSFEPLTPSTHTNEVFKVIGPDAVATGYPSNDGFVVLAGSKARAKEVPTMPPGYLALRNTLIAEKALLPDGGPSHILVVDYAFNSPSAAAAVFLARSANGRAEWRSTTSGLSLKEIEEAAAGEDDAD